MRLQDNAWPLIFTHDAHFSQSAQCKAPAHACSSQRLAIDGMSVEASAQRKAPAAHATA